ncbi:fimbrial protein [Salmonella enterica subsp. enterica serovar Hull]|uniref:Fimbrial protein n=1 Tax=Salmonella enterica subsp. enterica serovar Hull TaxID=1403564 RepID=A0A5X4PM81_SALET|nr:fimbrial protein [Salmonella enterica subsp. enterica serovar Putten]EBZ7588777.1 fimbrial protein [Salmonella enterica subsp. enterica serovar Hull]EBZ8651203.1 fimbrial protein [Salmonella enterica subsp. enterica serovar Hull]EEB7450875.1 fimbria/pilus periplasmic chaperone [Salmonella enterica subsp. enterica serovar Emek]
MKQICHYPTKTCSRLAYILVAGSVVGTLSTVHAAVSLDRTRAVFNGDNKSISLNISNENKQIPYLAQSWLEDASEKKITTGPLVVTPPVQRLEPGAKSMIRVMAGPGATSLPQDRESLFYFNLREIPPKSDKPNVLQIALQTRIKLFYRPAGIVQAPGAVWQDKLVLHPQADGYQIENPTAYYITIIGIGGTAEQAEKGKFDTVMVSPKSSVRVKSGTWATPYLTYINDYGGRPTLRFSCSRDRCEAKSKA